MSKLRPDPPSSISARPLAEAPPFSLSSLLLDQRRRWKNDDRVLLETYLLQYPSLQADSDALFELLCHEVVLRE
jgi:hypothetical protein